LIPGLLPFRRFAGLDRLLADVIEPVFGLSWMLSKRLASDVPERLVVVDINRLSGEAMEQSSENRTE
jgi:predicted amidohydrolase